MEVKKGNKHTRRDRNNTFCSQDIAIAEVPFAFLDVCTTILYQIYF